MLPANNFYFKVALTWVLVLVLGFAGYYAWTKYGNTSQKFTTPTSQDSNKENIKAEPEVAGMEGADLEEFSEPAAIPNKQSEKTALVNNKEARKPSDTSSNFNILVLGIDRRHGDQTSWRTDVIQLITLNPKRDHAVLTHIPRDVWTGNYKINALYNLQGPDAIKDEIQSITGQRPDRIIRVDFDAFVWAVDGVGGLTIDVPNGFTDEQYPDDRNGNEQIMTINFDKGQQSMNGERALTYVRSRKGNNGEGSDYARGTRQQLVMEAIIDDYFKPGNMFNPKTYQTLYNIATQKIYTDIAVADMPVLYDLLTNYKKFKMENLSLDTSNYLEVPSNKAAYGGAWVLIGKGGNYSAIHEKIQQLLGS